MPRKRLALLVTLIGCTPAQQRTTGVVVAGAGIVTMAAEATALGMCQDPAGQWRDCQQTRSSQSTTGVGVALASGLGLVLVGGLIYASSSAPPQSATTTPAPSAPPPAVSTPADACASGEYRAYENGKLCG